MSSDTGFQIMRSNKGKPMILVEGYKFRQFRVKKKNIHWRCSKKECRATIKTDVPMTTLLETTNKEHRPQHAPPSDKEIELQLIRTSLKRKATENLNEPPLKLIRHEVENSKKVTFSDLPSLSQSSYRARKKLKKPVPKNIDGALDGMASTVTSSDEKIIRVDKKHQIVAVTCKENLQFLVDFDDVILGDGTFTYAPKHFKQTYTIHVFHRGFYLHVATFFLPSKAAETYSAMWDLLKQMCVKHTGKELNVKLLLLDFESSAHKAAKVAFPNATIRGCRFHLGQSWWRRIQKYPVLRYAFTRSEKKGEQLEIQSWLQLFFSLSYLPANDVPAAFEQLASATPHVSGASAFVAYIRKNYINSKMFPPHLWASPLTQDSCTTTNGVEGFNSKLQGEFYYHHPSVYEATDQVFKAQTIVSLKIKSVRNGELFNKRKAQQTKDDEVIVLTSAFQSKDLDIMEFLEMIRDVKYAKQDASDSKNDSGAENDSFNEDDLDEEISFHEPPTSHPENTIGSSSDSFNEDDLDEEISFHEPPTSHPENTIGSSSDSFNEDDLDEEISFHEPPTSHPENTIGSSSDSFNEDDLDEEISFHEPPTSHPENTIGSSSDSFNEDDLDEEISFHEPPTSHPENTIGSSSDSFNEDDLDEEISFHEPPTSHPENTIGSSSDDSDDGIFFRREYFLS
nr:PREDICTED: uncharacterized protein LOC109034708 isoform X2 [Bemisia tabaci]